MQRFVRNGKTLWGGFHQVLGLVIYDPKRQQHLPDDTVRLYIVKERRMATFVKAIVRDKLVPCSRDTWCTGTPQPSAA